MSQPTDFDTAVYYATLPAEARLRTVVGHIDYIRARLDQEIEHARPLADEGNPYTQGRILGVERARDYLVLFDAVLAQTRAEMAAEAEQRAADSAETI